MRTKLTVLFVAGLATVTLATGCMTIATTAAGVPAFTLPGASANLSVDALARASLQASDLPAGYALEGGGPKQHASAQECLNEAKPQEAAAVPMFEALGLERCESVSYRKSVGTLTNSANTAGSKWFLFRDADSAAQALVKLQQLLKASVYASGVADPDPPTEVTVSGLGDETAPTVIFRVTLFGKSITLTFYIWRTGNAVFVYGASDVLRDMDQRSMLDVAKRLDSRARQ